MGCDIHVSVDVLNADGYWESKAPPTREWGGTSWFPYRNYPFFAVLAGVRNSYGLKPIDDPRGFPSDKRQLWGEEYAHSESWVTLDELLSYNWDSKVKLTAWVSGKTFSRWGGGRPEGFYGEISGKTVKRLSKKSMKQRIASGQPLEHCYTKLSWKETIRELVGVGVFDFIHELEELGEPENVRLVFWFDN